MPENPPVFPLKTKVNFSSDPLATPTEVVHPGMSLRDYFAGQALADLSQYYGGHQVEALAENCYRIADAMLEHREKSS